MRWAGWQLSLILLSVFLTGCATAVQTPRPASDSEKLTLARSLVPLLRAADLWHGPGDGCVALGVAPTRAINLAVAPDRPCKFALLVTEGALESLSERELQAALAHEIGHVTLGHFAARQARRQSEQQTDQQVDSLGSAGTATASVIPGVGPIIAAGVMTAQLFAQFVAKGTYRAYDRDEEVSADRFAATLLEKVEPGRCKSLRDLLERLAREATTPSWTAWLSTHPSPGRRREAASSACPGP